MSRSLETRLRKQEQQDFLSLFFNFCIYLYFSTYLNCLFCPVYLILFYSLLLSSSLFFIVFIPFSISRIFLYFSTLSYLFCPIYLILFFHLLFFSLLVLFFLSLSLLHFLLPIVSLFTKPFHRSQSYQQHKHMTHSCFSYHMITAFSSVCT
jgi:hypothetical protein